MTRSSPCGSLVVSFTFDDFSVFRLSYAVSCPETIDLFSMLVPSVFFHRSNVTKSFYYTFHAYHCLTIGTFRAQLNTLCTATAQTIDVVCLIDDLRFADSRVMVSRPCLLCCCFEMQLSSLQLSSSSMSELLTLPPPRPHPCPRHAIAPGRDKHAHCPSYSSLSA